jgi:hypothetical protein
MNGTPFGAMAECGIKPAAGHSSGSVGLLFDKTKLLFGKVKLLFGKVKLLFDQIPIKGGLL